MLVASNEWRSGMLLSTLQGGGQPPQQRIIQPNVHSVKVETTILSVNERFERLTKGDVGSSMGSLARWEIRKP